MIGQASAEGIGKIVADLGARRQQAIVAFVGGYQRTRSGEGDFRTGSGVNAESDSGAGFGAGKAAAAERFDVRTRNEGVGHDLRAEDLPDIVTVGFADLVIEIADGTAVINRLIRVGSGLVVHAQRPEEAIAVVPEKVSHLAVKVELIGDRPGQSCPEGLAEAVLGVGPQGVITRERLEAQIFPLRDEADVDLIAHPRKPSVALIIPEVFMAGLNAEPGLPDDEAIRLRADNIAEVEDAPIVAIVPAAAVAAANRRIVRSKAIPASGVPAVKVTALEKHGIVSQAGGKAANADAKIVREDHVPIADLGVPSDLGMSERLVTQPENVRGIKSEARDAGFVLQREINERAGNSEPESLGDLRNDGSTDRGDCDGPGFTALLPKLDIVAPKGSARNLPQFEIHGSQFQIGVLRLKAALKERK